MLAPELAREGTPRQNRLVHASTALDTPALRSPPLHTRVAPSAPAASALSGLVLYESDRDMPRVALPRPEIQLVARFAPSTSGGIDVHAMGVRAQVHRKLIKRGQRTIAARLQLGAAEAALGVTASALAGRIVPLQDLWGDRAARRLIDRLAGARDMVEATVVMQRAIAERLAIADGRDARATLAVHAAGRLASANVTAVAADLGVSERHLRRIFHEAVGVSPKAFARLTRFHRALEAATAGGPNGWASIAAGAGYYDQAHLIADFRAIAGATPRAFLDELRDAPPLG